MRPLEAGWIAASALSPRLILRKRTRAAWLAFAKAAGAFPKGSVPGVLKGIGVSLSVVLPALTSLAYAFPVFTLPTPTGPYSVGVTYLSLTDERRADPFLKPSTRRRRLRVKVCYPAKPDPRKPFVPYLHGSLELMRAWAAFYQMPRSAFDPFRLIPTHSKDDLVVSDAAPRYPVVLFSNGAGTTMESETSQSEDLASHGYIVVDVDHPYVSAATVFPDRIVTAREATTNFDTPEPAEPITQIMADDDTFVIEKLGAMNRGSITPAFKGRLNLDRIGVIGHSVGGATAYNLAIHNRRIKAAINLDGAVYVTPENGRSIAPFLMLANDTFHVQAIKSRRSLMPRYDQTPQSQKEMRDRYRSETAYDAAYQKAQRNTNGLVEVLKASGNFYTIKGSDHLKFTDIGLFPTSPRLRERIPIGGKTDAARCLKITQAVTRAFFDRHLKGYADTLPSLVKTYPELRKVDLNPGG